MAEKFVTVVDVGSSKISALCASRGVNNTFNLKAVAERPFGGFSEGQFFDEQEVYEVIKDLLDEIGEKLGSKIKEVYLGVPGAFVKLINKKFKISFSKPKRIREKDVQALFDEGQALIKEEGYGVIGRKQMFFALDDGRRVDNPIGTVSALLGGAITYFLCEEYFLQLLGAVFESLEIPKVNFVYVGQAEGGYLLGEDERDCPALIMDVGYITTDIALHYGNGVIAKRSEDIGGGILSFIFVRDYGLTPEEGEELKRGLNIGQSLNNSASYTIRTGDGVREFSVDEINEKAVECIDDIVGIAYEFLEANTNRVTDTPSLYLTGGGIAYLRGIKSHLSARLGSQVEILEPKVPFYAKAGESSRFSLLDFALKDKDKSKRSLFQF